ncbi:zinc finger CCCH-type antiviral protein 1-like isoform X4 [Hemicordylus capensis]|uniref:zinc finger CCCH-type antiviral protein 1-like isoform X4 n=1 Tax=Hemicordylus capensis TaxID=884348 RepID=UPI0023036B6D|nr:zinc finger CCCH-type antiviral protein 1-like isoform X4 [Hemicordylus capensis]
MIMSDPAVCSFITKILCSEGGCLDYKRIPQFLGLSEHQLEQILQDAGKERFLVNQQGTSCQVLAMSPVRLCLKNECGGCERLHICKKYIRGRCYRPDRGRGACKYSHEVFSEDNRKVMKNHELSGLNEDELRVLLLQNDPFLLPDVCNFYNKGEGNCTQQDNCPRLHICRYFLKGQCRFPRCKRSHSLLHPRVLSLLLADGVDDKVAWNIQTICEHKTATLSRELSQQRAAANITTSNTRHAANGNRGQSNAGDRREYIQPAANMFSFMGSGLRQGSSNLRPAASGDGVPTSPGDRRNDLYTSTSLKPALADLGLDQTGSSNLRPAASGDGVPTSPGDRRNDLYTSTSLKPALADLGLDQTGSSNLRPAASGDGVPTSPGDRRNDLYTSTSLKPALADLGLDQTGFSNLRRAASREGVQTSAGDWTNYLNTPTFLKTALADLGLDQGVKAASTKLPQNTEQKKIDEICVYYVWRFCKNKNNCNMIHYELPYRWQKHTGAEWKDFANMEVIEKAYCDPNSISVVDANINFKTMLSYIHPVRRLSTPSSVTKPAKFVMTTKWLWYWKNDVGQWIEFGKQDGQTQASLSSDDLENLFLADPNGGSIQFKAGSQQYEINFKDMTQRNLHFLTLREIRRRPKFVSSDDVKKKKGHVDHAAPSTQESNHPKEWDKYALPDIGYKAIELSKISPEYTKIETLFQKTMSNYVITRIRRIQNPSLWQVYQWQKEQMRKKKGGRDIAERLLFHGTGFSTLEAICNDNFDWRICGTNGTVLGKGSYFARDAQYSHNYCQPQAKVKTMFVAQVLVGDFIRGNAAYTRPPAKSADMLNCYDSCVDNTLNPSIFVIFEKHQIYPAYMIDYSEEEKKCVLS